MRSARSRSEGSSIYIGLSYWPERSGMVWDGVGFYWYDPMVWYQRGISHVGQNPKKRSDLDIR